VTVLQYRAQEDLAIAGPINLHLLTPTPWTASTVLGRKIPSTGVHIPTGSDIRQFLPGSRLEKRLSEAPTTYSTCDKLEDYELYAKSYSE